MVFLDAVDHHFHRLLAVRRVKHDRFVQVHVFLRQVNVIDQQLQVGELMLGVGLGEA
jgi:hypothetical protein